MILERKRDYLTIIVKRKRQTSIKLDDGSTLQVKCALGFEIAQLLKTTTKKEKFGEDFSTQDGSIYFSNQEETLGLQYKGSFPVFHQNSNEIINEVLGLIKAKGYEYHFNRYDICYVLDEPVFKELVKSDFKKLERDKKDIQGEEYWLSVFSTIFGVVSYNKQKQLKKIKKKQEDYFKHYKGKYGDKPIFHFELRFFSFQYKKKNSPLVIRRIPSIWEYPINFEKVEAEIIEEILARVKFNKRLLHLIKNNGGK